MVARGEEKCLLSGHAPDIPWDPSGVPTPTSPLPCGSYPEPFYPWIAVAFDDVFLSIAQSSGQVAVPLLSLEFYVFTPNNIRTSPCSQMPARSPPSQYPPVRACGADGVPSSLSRGHVTWFTTCLSEFGSSHGDCCRAARSATSYSMPTCSVCSVSLSLTIFQFVASVPSDPTLSLSLSATLATHGQI